MVCSGTRIVRLKTGVCITPPAPSSTIPGFNRFKAWAGAAQRSAPAGTAGAAKESELVTEPAVLDAFLAGVERRALGLARLATGDPEEALDAVQDAMLRFVRSYGRRPEEEWRPLFYKVLVNRIRDGYRRQAVRNRFTAWLARDDQGSDPLEALPGTPGDRPDEQAAAGEAMDALALAMKGLPARQREAFMLRCLEGLDVRATAAAMGCSEGSVKTHYFRALASLREQLEDYR